MEIWKDVKGYEGHYQISNLGRVKSLARSLTNSVGKVIPYRERILKYNTTPKGYQYVGLSKNSAMKSLKVYRLVAIAFIPNPENKPQVNHKNGNKADNSVSNLEWATSSDNIRHAVATGLKVGSKGIENGMRKLTEKEVLEIRDIKGLSQLKIGAMYGVTASTVFKIQHKICWAHI